jgi:predicted NBD/HSP70 family sugar kinase
MAAAVSGNRDAPVRQGSLREHNLGLVLRHVAGIGRPVSRADVAAATGLTKATISALVDDLRVGGLLVEVDPPPRAGAGRPPIGLVLATDGPAGLGLEVNVDYLAACVLDLTGAQRILRIHRADQRGRPPDLVLDDLAQLAADVVAEAEKEGLIVAGTILGVPGLVADDGVVRRAPNLGWRDVDVGAGLRSRANRIGVAATAMSLTIDNEANLAALAELHAVDDPRASFVYISGEIGVGAGVVIDGQLMRGSRGYGGELGHMTVYPDGADCRCGARGCLEAYANQEVLFRAAGLDGEDPSRRLDLLVEQAATGARPTARALADVGIALGIAAAGVVNLLDVDAVVLGGIYAPLARWLVGPVSQELSRRAIAAAWSPVVVRPATLGTTAAVVGAAGSVVRAVREAPAVWLAHSAPT